MNQLLDLFKFDLNGSRVEKKSSFLLSVCVHVWLFPLICSLELEKEILKYTQMLCYLHEKDLGQGYQH